MTLSSITFKIVISFACKKEYKELVHEGNMCNYFFESVLLYLPTKIEANVYIGDFPFAITNGKTYINIFLSTCMSRHYILLSLNETKAQLANQPCR